MGVPKMLPEGAFRKVFGELASAPSLGYGMGRCRLLRGRVPMPPTPEEIRWRPGDLGKPIPEDPHAISVCLPTWKDVIGYEEGDPAVCGVLQAGYPRFVLPSQVKNLQKHLGQRSGGSGRRVFPYLSAAAAQRAAEFVGEGAEIGRDDALGLSWVAVSGEESLARAVAMWRYAGEGLSSRAAESVLAGRKPHTSEGEEARNEIRKRLADEHGVPVSAVYLFSSGMAAVSTVHRLLQARNPDAGVVQVDFPYVDVSRVQRHVGNGRVRQIHAEKIHGEKFAEAGVQGAFDEGFRAGVYVELPSNPLLVCADLPGLSVLAREAGVPVVADDTIASSRQLQVLPHADLVTTSLSKWFNGRCNLLAGAVVLNPASPMAESCARWLDADSSAWLADEDAVELAINSRGFAERMSEVGARGEEILEFLRRHPAVERVWAADFSQCEGMRVEGGGRAGGLFSFTLVGGEAAAAAFYDAVRIAKGPSLGADFSLLCPYTLLAHYDELGHARSWGVPRDLLRLSVGREAAGVLAGRLEAALTESKET